MLFTESDGLWTDAGKWSGKLWLYYKNWQYSARGTWNLYLTWPTFDFSPLLCAWLLTSPGWLDMSNKMQATFQEINIIARILHSAMRQQSSPLTSVKIAHLSSAVLPAWTQSRRGGAFPLWGLACRSSTLHVKGALNWTAKTNIRTTS